jgi:alcohol dehydrogenase class IV
VVFGRGTLAEAPGLAGPGYALLSTPRARETAPALASGARAVHHVAPGPVDELAAGLRGRVREDTVVALGGGRVIDVAKAIAAADGRRVVGVPTTLSGAEMTAIHRLPLGVAATVRRVRPAVVVNDPDLSASQPAEGLLASAMNAMGHAVEAPLTTRANPISTLAALEAARLIADAGRADPPDRDALALGALLAGYAIDGAGYGLHHVMSQTLVRHAGVGHGQANACLLPHTLGALRSRFPAGIDRLREALGDDPVAVATRTAAAAGASRLRDLGVAEAAIPDLARQALARPDLALTPPPAEREELEGLYDRAW